MTGALLWGNPLALLGMAAVALPILVHLLATTRARRMPFPTLRFLPASMPAAMRAHRLEDPWLLLLRCLIVVLAAVALAQPWLALDGRDGAAGEVRTAVVVDVSDSMARATASGETALQAAGAAAQELLTADPATTVIETDDLAAGLTAARLRLETAALGRAGAAEVVVLSDFQRGSLEPDDLAALPEGVGVRLRKIDVVAASEIDTPVLVAGDRAFAASLRFDDQQAVVQWRAEAPAGDTGVVAGDAPADTGGGLESAVAAGQARAAQATLAAAARYVPVPLAAEPRPVTVVWPGAPERAELRAAAGPIDQPWMADALAVLPPDQNYSAGSRDGRLLLFAGVEPGSARAAALIAALRRAGGYLEQLGELEPESIAAATLSAWERPAAEHAAAAGSDARWMWLAVLALLLVEQRVRRAAPHRNDGGDSTARAGATDGD